ILKIRAFVCSTSLRKVVNCSLRKVALSTSIPLHGTMPSLLSDDEHSNFHPLGPPMPAHCPASADRCGNCACPAFPLTVLRLKTGTQQESCRILWTANRILSLIIA